MFFDSIKKLKATITPNRVLIVLGVLMCLGFGILYWFLGTLDLIGFTRDDGIYLISSEALAKAGKFNLWHLIADPPQVKYPIGYPLLLMPVWWLNPDFPQNQPLLIAVTSSFGALALISVFTYFLRIRRAPAWFALIITLLLACNFYWVFFAAGLMAEAPYLFFSFLALIILEPKLSAYCKDSENRRLKTLLFCAAVAAIPFHFRQIGLCIPLAGALYLFLNKRYRDSFLFLAIVLLLSFIPWFIWVKTHYHITPLTYETILGYAPYTSEFLINFKGGGYGRMLIESLGSIVYRILEGMVSIIPNFFKVLSQVDRSVENNRQIIRAFLIGSTACAYALSGYFVLMLVKRANRIRRQAAWGQISIGCWYLLGYMTLCFFWAYEEQISRFLPMVLPFLWFYALGPVVARIQANRHRIPNVLLLVFVVWLALFPANKTFMNIHYIRTHYWIDQEGHPLWEDYAESFLYTHFFLDKKAKIATTHETVVYLYTGHKVYHLNDYAFKERLEKLGLEKAFAERMRNIRALGVDYVMVEPAMQNRRLLAKASPATQGFIDFFPEQFRLIFVAKNGYVRIYRLLPRVSPRTAQ